MISCQYGKINYGKREITTCMLRALSVLHKVAPMAAQREPSAVDLSTSTSARALSIFVLATLKSQKSQE